MRSTEYVRDQAGDLPRKDYMQAHVPTDVYF